MNENILILEKKVVIFHKLYKKWEGNNTIDELTLKEILYDILSWIEVCCKDIQTLTKKESKLISAFKYANNVKKHSVSVFECSLRTVALLTSDDLFSSDNLFPSSFDIKWNDLPLDNMKFKCQYNNYNEYLKGKSILDTLDELINIINQKSPRE